MAKLLIKIARHLEREARRQEKDAQRTARRRDQEAQRSAKVQQRELVRRLKEQARLSALEQARLEVEKFENEIDVLLSIHKESAPSVDWHEVASRLLPAKPFNFREYEFEAALLHVSGAVIGEAFEANLAEARRLDAEDLGAEEQSWSEECRSIERRRGIARRFLDGELDAYRDAVTEFSGIGEVRQLGTSLEVIAHSTRIVECRLVVNGSVIIPSEVLKMSAGGKVSRKAMPKSQFHDLYQDHVCSCVLRIARAVMAVLPIKTVIVTASVMPQANAVDQRAAFPILSVAFPRSRLEGLPFETLDPSDTIETFTRRGDVRASRRTGAFVAIEPLRVEEVDLQGESPPAPFAVVVADAGRLLDELGALLARVTRAS